jgi:hypothetical protein
VSSLGDLQCRGGIVELLRGRRPLRVQSGDPSMRRARQIEGGDGRRCLGAGYGR